MTNTTPDGHADPSTSQDLARLEGRYVLGQVIGRGGAATVHEAFDTRLRRPVAVKVFRDDGDIGEDSVRRFVDEAHLLAGLRHPGLVEIYDFGRTPQGPYLVLELIPGLTLQRRLAVDPLPAREAARMGAALARTLAYVHAAGVVHRDLKPSNILLDVDGRPRLADFGVSRTLGTPGSTKTGNVVGTAAYLAPEQVLGRPAECAADVYALGLVIIECLSGSREYPGPPAEAAVVRLHRPPCVPEGVPEDLARVLRRMTATEPGDRPSAEECAGLLESAGMREVVADRFGVAAGQVRDAGLAWDTRLGWDAGLGSEMADTPVSTQAVPTVWVPVASAAHAGPGQDTASEPHAGTGTSLAAEPRARRGAAWSMAALALLTVSGAGAMAAVPVVGRSATQTPARPPAPAQSSSIPAQRSSVPAKTSPGPAKSADPARDNARQDSPSSQTPKKVAPIPPAAPAADPNHSTPPSGPNGGTPPGWSHGKGIDKKNH